MTTYSPVSGFERETTAHETKFELTSVTDRWWIVEIAASLAATGSMAGMVFVSLKFQWELATEILPFGFKVGAAVDILGALTGALFMTAVAASLSQGKWI
jgi:hypothetical protein